MKVFIAISALLMFCVPELNAQAQSQDESAIRNIFDKALAEGQSYQMLEHLSTKIGSRLSGSPNAAKAVEWTRDMMKAYGFDSVWLQPVMVPHWVRGQKEIAHIVKSKKTSRIDLSVCALGNSVGTGSAGITGNIVEIKNFDELTLLGENNIKGKIVFFNRPMDRTKVQAFDAYEGAVGQRVSGASKAAKFGATGVIVRSMGLNIESYPHTGVVVYKDSIPKIPAVAISTRDADLLSGILKSEPALQVYFETHSMMLEDAPSYNVIGEIKGSQYPDEIIVVGGHLDSWDLGQGAHDDGAGCVQSIEALRIFKAMGYKPKRTVRAVMFMNEENGLRGGREYANQAKQNKETHIAAIESDAGGFSPRGFTITGTDEAKSKIRGWENLFRPYGVHDFSLEGGGADIGPLESQGVTLIGLLPDSQRYFSYHHTQEDTFDKVERRELELGSATMASLIYLIDQHGIK